MRVSCPGCQTEYEVPDAALTGRARIVRCSNCMTKWQVPALEMYRAAPVPPPAAPPPGPADPAAAGPAETGPVDPPEAAGEAEVMVEPAADEAMAEAAQDEPPPLPLKILKSSREAPAVKQKPPSKRGLRISILLVLLIIVSVLAEHRAIGNFWPPSLRLFNALGLR